MNKLTLSLALVGLPAALYKIRKYCNGPKCQYNPNLQNKIIIVTGSNVGLGKETALQFAKLGATIVFANRNESQTKEVMKQIETVTNNQNLFFIKLDLSDFESIKQFAAEFKQKFNQLNILVNNAGAINYNEQYSKQGIELTIHVNHFGHALLTYLLLDVIKNTPQSRIVCVSAKAYQWGAIDYNSLKNQKKSRQKYHSLKVYGDSKIYNIQFAAYLQKILDDNNIDAKSVSLHPGVSKTELARSFDENIFFKTFNIISYPIMQLVQKNIEYLSQTTLHCSLIDYDKLEKGAYYMDCATKKVKEEVLDSNNLKQLKEITEEILNIDLNQLLKTK